MGKATAGRRAKVKAKASSPGAAASANAGAGAGAGRATIAWPALDRKRRPLDSGSVDWAIPGQLGVVHAFLSERECGALVAACGAQRFEPSPPAKRGEARRSNERWAVQDAAFAAVLWGALGPACAAWVGEQGGVRGLPASGLSSNIRVYRYSPGQAFGAHYDGSATDPVTLKTTEWTLLIYLTGAQDGVAGGETVFYHDHARKDSKAIVMPLERGAALLHRHGDACMLHEARPPTAGVKWVLRSDVTFG